MTLKNAIKLIYRLISSLVCKVRSNFYIDYFYPIKNYFHVYLSIFLAIQLSFYIYLSSYLSFYLSICPAIVDGVKLSMKIAKDELNQYEIWKDYLVAQSQGDKGVRRTRHGKLNITSTVNSMLVGQTVNNVLAVWLVRWWPARLQF